MTSLDDLLVLVKERGTPDAFPDRDELHALLEPFRAMADQESLRLALAATVRKSDRLAARVAAEALAFLGGEAAAGLLIGIAMDESLGTSQRAAVVWAMDRHLPAARARLGPGEQSVLMSLPVFEILEDPEADHGFGLQALLASYARFSKVVRTTFLAVTAREARQRGLRMAGLCMHLLGVETDRERRLRLLDLAAADASQEAADLLATFAAQAADPDEGKHARRYVQLLQAKGVRGAVRAELQTARVLVTGVDGDACFAINLIVPRVPTFEFANLLFHLETGLRDGFVMHSLPGRDVDELVGKIQRECGTFSAFVPLALAARMVDEVKAASQAAVVDNADALKAMALAERALALALREPWSDPPPAATQEATPEDARALLESRGFESWFFESGEAAVKDAIASLRKSVPARGKSRAKALAERVEGAAAGLAQRLVFDGEPRRLQRMLLHQARLLVCLGDDSRANLCRRLAADVSRPASALLATMAKRAVLDGLAGAPDDRPARFIEAREHLRAVVGQGEGYAKARVAELDLSAVAHAELVMRNRELPSSRRAALVAIESAALRVGQGFVEAVARGAASAEIELAVREVLGLAELFGPKQRKRIAAEVTTAMTEFRAGICGTHCTHRCFDDPAGDGRTAFYAEGLPWQGEPSPRRGRRGRT